MLHFLIIQRSPNLSMRSVLKTASLDRGQSLFEIFPVRGIIGLSPWRQADSLSIGVIEMPVVSFSLSDKLMERFSEILAERGYSSKSEAFREAIRDYIVEYEWTRELGESAVAVITVLYARETPKSLVSDLQHEYEDVVQALMHVHLDNVNCLEVFIAKGNGKRIGELIDKIKPIKGVKQVKLIATACEI